MLLILLIVFAVSYMDRQLLAILIDPIKSELDISDSSAGLLYGFTFAVFYSLLGIPIARLADRSNRFRIILISLVLFSAMTAVSAGAVTYWQLLLARIGVGVGEAGTSPPSHSIIADLYPLERRSTAMAIFALGPHVGVLLGFLIGGFLGQWLGWRAVFLFAGVIGLVVALVSARVIEEPRRMRRQSATQQPSSIDALRTLLRSPALRQLLIGASVVNMAVAALVAWLPAFMMRSYGLSLSATGVLLALVLGVLGGCGTLFGGWLADRHGARDSSWRVRCIVVVLLVCAACWTVAITVGNAGVALAALAAAGSLIAFHVGPSFAMVQSLAPPHIRAFAAACLLFAANLIGLGVGPLAVGLLSDAWYSQHGADSLRMGLMIVPPIMVWAAIHYQAAARRITADLRSVSAAHLESPDASSTAGPTAGANLR
jgi:predicted MFS family arabinose efflux permease